MALSSLASKSGASISVYDRNNKTTIPIAHPWRTHTAFLTAQVLICTFSVCERQVKWLLLPAHPSVTRPPNDASYHRPSAHHTASLTTLWKYDIFSVCDCKWSGCVFLFIPVPHAHLTKLPISYPWHLQSLLDQLSLV